MDNEFESNVGKQNIAQGDHAIGRQINTYGIPTEVFAEYAEAVKVRKKLEQLLMHTEEKNPLSVRYIQHIIIERKKVFS